MLKNLFLLHKTNVTKKKKTGLKSAIRLVLISLGEDNYKMLQEESTGLICCNL